MVSKWRVVQEYEPFIIDGVTYASNTSEYRSESMSDSSITGSARTDIDPVDQYLADPTTRGGFHRALRESNKQAGDAGLADFRVDRTKRTWALASGDFYGRPFSGFSFSHHFNGSWPYTPPAVPLTEAQLKQRGQELYFQALPMKNQADLGTALMEFATNPMRALMLPGSSQLRQARRLGRRGKAKKSSLNHRHRQIRGLPLEEARAAADDYLAYIFGVRPNVKTLDDLAEAISRSRSSAEVVSRSGMRRIRRRREAPPVVVTEVAHTPNYWAVVQPQLLTAGLYGSLHQSVTSYSRTWWSGAFRMPVSETDTWLDQSSNLFRELDRISGLGLDPRVAWDLIPFSFIADWFANTGDLLEHRQIIADYNITCEYGYVMNHTRNTRTWTHSGYVRASPSATGGAPVTFQAEEIIERKLRTRSSSFGFYTDFDSLNAFQWSALTAIGLSSAAGVVPNVRE